MTLHRLQCHDARSPGVTHIPCPTLALSWVSVLSDWLLLTMTPDSRLQAQHTLRTLGTSWWQTRTVCCLLCQDTSHRPLSQHHYLLPLLKSLVFYILHAVYYPIKHQSWKISRKKPERFLKAISSHGSQTADAKNLIREFAAMPWMKNTDGRILLETRLWRNMLLLLSGDSADMKKIRDRTVWAFEDRGRRPS